MTVRAMFRSVACVAIVAALSLGAIAQDQASGTSQKKSKSASSAKKSGGASSSAAGDAMAQVQQKETALWEAWKNNDYTAFDASLSDKSTEVSSRGITVGKTDLVNGMKSSGCKVNSYNLSDWNSQWLDHDKHVLLITYKGTADGDCGGQKLGAVNASSVWVNEGGQWKAAFHQESDAAPAQGGGEQ